MHQIYGEFLEYLDNEDKENCINLITSKLDKKELDIPTLYKEILEPSLNAFYCDAEEEKMCIWKEHIRTSIIRTIIEICYLYILKERKEKGVKLLNQTILIGCPAEEYHDTGAKMIADIFTLYGFNAIFVGANTPREEVRDAINLLKPKFIGISVTISYNLVEAEKTISLIKQHTEFDGKIVVGGQAFQNNPDNYKKIGADILIRNFNEIEKLAKEG